MSRSSHGDDSDRTSESSELVIDKNNGLKEEASTRTLPLLQPKIRRHRPNPPTLFPIQVDPYCNDLRSTTRYEMNDNSCAIEPPHDLLLCNHENRVLPNKMSPHFLRTMTLRSNDSNEIITDSKQDAPSGSDDVKLIVQDLDIFSPYLSEPSEIYGDLCRVSFQLSPDDGNTKKPASSITNQQYVYSSPSHIARSHHLPYPAPRQRQNSSRSLFDMSDDPLEWILRADAIAEAERMNEPLTDDEGDDDNEGVDANFFLRLPSVDETNRVVSNNSCLLEEDKSLSRMSISVVSPSRFKTPPPSTV